MTRPVFTNPLPRTLLLGAFVSLTGLCLAGDSVPDALMPLLRTYCLDCHDQKTAEADIALEPIRSAGEMRDKRALWHRVLKQVEVGVMPPPDAEEMPDNQRRKLIALVDDLVNGVDCSGPVNPGKVTVRRLNRSEYRYTIRDLTGIDYKPAKNFPGDDVGYGFDNIGDVLSLPTILLEKYLKAAEEITGRAILTPKPPEKFRLEIRGADLSGVGNGARDNGHVVLTSAQEISLQPNLPFAGEYALAIAAFGDQAGNEPAKMEIRIDGKRSHRIDVPAIDPEVYTINLRLGSGQRNISFDFLNDYYKAGVKGQPTQDRNLHIVSVRLTSVSAPPRKPILERDRPETHRKLIFVRPGKGKNAADATAEVMGRFASRAFRRPVTADEIARLTAIAAKVRDDGGSFDEGIQVAMQAVLVSPHFLYKYEQPRLPRADGSYPSVNDFELASRISYFLWSSMPDDKLLLSAMHGKLRQPQELRAQVMRLLKHRRSVLMIDNFASQWLGLRNLRESNPDKKQFPDFNEKIRALLHRETLTFFSAIVVNDLSVTRLLDGQFTYLNEPLAEFYGIDGVQGDEFRYVSLAGSPRGGLLTQASVLTVTSNPTRTSPVKRGKWILDNILGTPPPPAPPDVPELEKSKLKGSLRERLVQHRDNPACASCHKLMDPLGFALENFDAVGHWRTTESGRPIDASGELPNGLKLTGIDDLRRILTEQRRDDFVRCLTEKMLTFALGRGLEYYDRCAVTAIVDRLKANNYRFSELVTGIVESEPFQKQGTRQPE